MNAREWCYFEVNRRAVIARIQKFFMVNGKELETLKVVIDYASKNKNNNTAEKEKICQATC